MDARHREYRARRAQGWTASQAWRNAKIRARFAEMETQGLCKYRIEMDEFAEYANLAGDCFGQKAKDSAPGGARAVVAQEKAFKALIDRDGVWGIIGEYKCPSCGEWTQADSCWGFTGDDWQFSGYLEDIMQATMQEYFQHVLAEA